MRRFYQQRRVRCWRCRPHWLDWRTVGRVRNSTIAIGRRTAWLNNDCCSGRPEPDVNCQLTDSESVEIGCRNQYGLVPSDRRAVVTV